jgi:hypothetical protein
MNDKQPLYTIVYKTQAYPEWERQREQIENAMLEYSEFKEANEVLRRIMDMK